MVAVRLASVVIEDIVILDNWFSSVIKDTTNFMVRLNALENNLQACML
ncbi:MAG: hypothetical protein ACSLEM_05930 [Candidatus Malihini olakiniferum]